MKERLPYDDAVDLLDADHKAVKKMFGDHVALCDAGAPATVRRRLAQRICQALAVQAHIEEEIFYPRVRQAIGNDALMDEALRAHAEVAEAIGLIQAMKLTDAAHDVAVKQLGMLIDQHVLEERLLIFPKARAAAIDLSGMALQLHRRQQDLQKAGAALKREARPWATTGRLTLQPTRGMLASRVGPMV